MKQKASFGGAYYTVEATFVVTICVFVVMAILYTGLYVHDRMLVESYSQGSLSLWARSSDDSKTDEIDLEDKIEEGLRRNLFLFNINSVNISGGLLSYTLEISYSYPISITWLERSLGGGSNVETYSVESVVPARLKWDSQALDELNGGKEDD